MNSQASPSNKEALDALWVATMNAHVDANPDATIEKMLRAIKAGAHPDQCINTDGVRLLDALAKKGGLQLKPLVGVLCANGANPLHDGLAHDLATNYSTLAPTFIEASATHQFRDSEGGCVLHGMSVWARSAPDDEWMRWLLNAALAGGATLEVKDHKGNTALKKLWQPRYDHSHVADCELAHSQWFLTDQLLKKGLANEQLQDPEILDLIINSGFGPGQYHPEQLGQFAAMDYVESISQHQHIASNTPSPSAPRSPRRV